MAKQILTPNPAKRTDALWDPAFAASVALLLQGTVREEASDSKSHPSRLRRWFFRAKRSMSRR